MHLVTDNAAPAAFPDLPPKARPVSRMEGTTNGLPWRVFELAFEYGFAVGGAAQYIGAAEHETAPKAEKAARRWCEAYVAEPVFDDIAATMAERELSTRGLSRCIAADPPPPALEVVSAEAFDAAVFGAEPPAPAAPVAGPPVIGGWRIEVSDGRAGTVKAELFNDVTGAAGALDQDFTGYEDARAALSEASLWAVQHPCDTGEDAQRQADACVAGWAISVEQSSSGKFEPILVDVHDGKPYHGLEDFSGYDTREEALEEASRWAAGNHTDAEDQRRMAAEDAAAALPQPVADQLLALGDSAEVVLLRAEVDLLREQLAAANAGIAADVGGLLAKAERHDELLRRQAALTFQAQGIKDELKGVVQELASLGVEGFGMIKALSTGTRAKTWQLGLTLDASSAVRASVGAQAAQAVAAIGTQKWAFLGTEHVIESSNQDTPQGLVFTTWIKGHRETTEGFGETYEQAAGQTRNAASVVFADCDPGQTTPSVDPAVRMPPKRGRKPKLGGHSFADVSAALADAASTVEAAMSLGVTPQNLTTYCGEHGLALPGATAPKAKRGRKAVAT